MMISLANAKRSDLNLTSSTVIALIAILLISSHLQPHHRTVAQSSRNSGAFGFDNAARSRSSSFEETDSSDWQPLPLRSSFRPLNSASRSLPPSAPSPPEPPSPPQPPSLPEALALIRGEGRRGLTTTTGSFDNSDSSVFARDLGVASSLASSGGFRESLFAQPATIVTSTTPSPVAVTTLAFEEDDEPTRQPMNRFRPTRPPARDDEDSGDAPSRLNAASGRPSANNNLQDQPSNSESGNNATSYTINNECFECICEASTNCNTQSRCQTSDVRHTRCGLFLITYDQWLASGLSKQLVSEEALARDVAADERAYYECVISRDCAEQLLSAYMASQLIDCDRDGRLNCYDVAAIHQAGPDKCRSEAMLESQYWSDFNACYGFAARR